MHRRFARHMDRLEKMDSKMQHKEAKMQDKVHKMYDRLSRGHWRYGSPPDEHRSSNSFPLDICYGWDDDTIHSFIALHFKAWQRQDNPLLLT